MKAADPERHCCKVLWNADSANELCACCCLVQCIGCESCVNNCFLLRTLSDKKNMAAYGEPEPPEYDVSNIRVPVAMFVGSEDQLADPVDSKMLAKKLRTLVHYREVRFV